MSFRLSGDQLGAGFGFLTTAREYDKWSHAAGSALFLVVVWTLLYWKRGELSLYETLLASTIVVFLGGIGLEIWQGIKGGRAQRRLEEQISTFINKRTWIEYIQKHDPVSPEFKSLNNQIKNTRYNIGYLDGFSIRDIIADVVGIAAVWALYYVVIRGA